MSRTRSTLAAVALAGTATVLAIPVAQAAAPQAQTGAVTSYCDHHPEKCGGVGAGEGGSVVGASPTEIALGTSLAVIGVGGAVVAWRRRTPASALV
jgi:hypothetical protein